MSDQSGTGATPSPTTNEGESGATPIATSMGTVVIPSATPQTSETPTEATDTSSDRTRDAETDTHREEEVGRDANASPDDLRKALNASRKAERQAAKELKRLQEAEQARIDANKSELERATERAQRAEARIAEIEHESLAKQVANESGLPAGSWHRLSGSDLRALRADAARMREELGLTQPVGMDGGVRSLGAPPQPVGMDDLIRGSVRR
jgi:flagellar biosynthesis GTPase FlhF